MRARAGDRSLLATLQEVHLRGLTGVLQVEGAGGAGRLFFVGGELYLAPDHPLGPRLAAWLAEPTAAEDDAVDTQELGDVEPPAADLVEVLVETLLATGGEACEFEEGPGRITSDLVGPLQSAGVLMELAIADRDEFQLLRSLGGEERRFVAISHSLTWESSPELRPAEAFLLSRLEHPVAIKDLLRQSDLDRRAALQNLCRLYAVDLIRPEEHAPARQAAEFLSPALLAKFSQRIEESLGREPLEIATDEHRRLVAGLLGRIGDLNFFELLEVGLGSSLEEIHDAYTDLARRLHPSHCEPLGFEGREGAFEMLFERATEAYLTLSDPDRSRAYQLQLGPALRDVKSSRGGGKREQEERDLAERNYRLARVLADRQDFFSAIQLLEQVVKLRPTSQYHSLLAECQAQNPKWLDRALYHYSRAVELDPEDPELRTRFGAVYEKVGNLSRAREEYSAALERMPGLPEAVEGLERLAAAAAGGRSAAGLRGVLSRWRRK